MNEPLVYISEASYSDSAHEPGRRYTISLHSRDLDVDKEFFEKVWRLLADESHGHVVCRLVLEE